MYIIFFLEGINSYVYYRVMIYVIFLFSFSLFEESKLVCGFKAISTERDKRKKLERPPLICIKVCSYNNYCSNKGVQYITK